MQKIWKKPKPKPQPKYSTNWKPKPETCKQGYHFVGNDQFSGVFLGSRRSKMFPTGFIGVCRLGSEKLFLGVLTKNKIFTQLSFLEFYADSEF